MEENPVVNHSTLLSPGEGEKWTQMRTKKAE